MLTEIQGETVITPDELYKYSKNVSRVRQIITNLLLFGVIVLIFWFALPTVKNSLGVAGTGLSDLSDVFVPEVPEGAILMPGKPVILFFIALVGCTFLASKLIYRMILKPLVKTVFRRSSENISAVQDARSGWVTYKIDKFGFECDIQSSEATNKHKHYWRNFSDVEYSPEIIRLYKGKTQKAFILMRAFPGKEKKVGQFVETAMRNALAKNRS